MQDTLFDFDPIEVLVGQECNTCHLMKPFDLFQIERTRTQGDEEFFYKHRCKDCCSRLGKTQRSLGALHRNRLYYEQNGCCAYCKRPEDSSGRPLGLDHCHYTGRVRGLLDMKCNTGIGMLGLDCPPDELDWRLSDLGLYLKGPYPA